MATTIDFIVKNGLLVQGVGSAVSTSTGTGALVVNGGGGFNGDIHAHNIFANNAEVLTTSTIETYDKIVHSIIPGTDISVNTTTNVVTINATSTLQSVTDRGSSTTNVIKVLNNTSSTSITTGALTVSGGVGISGNTYIGGNLVVSGTINATITGVISTATNLAGGAATNIPFQSGPGQTAFSNDLVFNNSTKQFSVGYANIWGDTSLGYGISSSTNVVISADSSKTIQIVSDQEAALNFNNTNTVKANASGIDLTANNYTLLWDTAGVLTANGANQTADYLGAGSFRLTGGAYIGNNAYIVSSVSAGTVSARNLTNGRLVYTFGNQLTDSPKLLYDGTTFTVPNLSTTGTVNVNNVTQSVNSLSGALIVDGGTGIGGNLNVGGGLQVWGPTTFGGSVVFSGTATYVLSTNTVYTDNILELHTTGTVATPWAYDDGKDIGLRFHYYNRTLNTGTNAALVLANDTQWLEWYGSGAEGTSTFSGYTYGGFKTGEIWVVSTTNATTSTKSGALSVDGGVSIVRDLRVGGTIYQGNEPVITPSQLSTITVVAIAASTGISVTTATGVVTIASTATLQNVTDRGSSTTNTIQIVNSTDANNSSTGALIVSGGVAIGRSLWVDRGLTAQNATITNVVTVGTDTGTIGGNDNLIQSPTSGSWLNIKGGGGRAKISIGNDLLYIMSGSAASSGILFHTNSTSTTDVGTEKMRLTLEGNLGLGLVAPTTRLDVSGGVRISGITTITNTTAATSPSTGALVVSGGVGISGTLWANQLRQTSLNIAIGSSAGASTQSSRSIAIGGSAGKNSQGGAGGSAIAIGSFAGFNNQQNQAIAIGETAGYQNQGNSTIAIGTQAGNTSQQSYAISIGYFAGSDSQGDSSIAIGNGAGYSGQGKNAIAIGSSAGGNFAGFEKQGESSIAIGNGAGTYRADTGTIILNATGNTLDSLTTDSFYVAPIRSDASSSATTWSLFYNPSTSEITTASISPFASVFTITNTTTATSTGTGALVVAGGASIGGDLWIGGILYSGGQAVLTTSSFFSAISEGTDIRITEGSSGTVIISNTSTLQTVTDRGSTTTNVIRFANITQSTNTLTGALTVAGGVGIAGQLNVGGSTSTIAGSLSVGTTSSLPAWKLYVLGSAYISGEFSADPTSSNINLGLNQTTGNWTAGGARQTGTITIGRSTLTQILSVANGAIGPGVTKTVNIGAEGLSSSTTLINIGTTNTGSTSTINLNGNIVIASGSKNSSAWTTNGVAIVQSVGTWTDATSTGTVANVYMNYFAPQTMSAANATTVTTLFGTYFKDPIRGTNVAGSILYSVGADTLYVAGNLYSNGITCAGQLTLAGLATTTTAQFATGATTAGNTKTVNIGTGGLAGSTTVINVGTTASTSTIVLNGTVPTASISTLTVGKIITAPLATISTLTVSKTVADPVPLTVDTSQVVLDSFATTQYRSAKYFISISNTTTNQFQTTEIWLVQDGASAHIEQTSVFSSGTNVVAFTTEVSTGTVSLIALGTNPNNQIKVQSTYITV